MQTQLRFFPISKLVIVSIACALFLSACGSGSSPSAPGPNSNVTGVATPPKVSVVNTNQ